MLIERQQRDERVRFQHPIRVVTLEGQPRVIHTLTANVSRDGLFLRMPEPLPQGMKVALSLEAGGRALALAQAEVVWHGDQENEVSERFSGCGVRFTEFMHPRAEELVRYLVKNLDQGKPLVLAPPERRWTRWLPAAAGAALLACAALTGGIFWAHAEPAQLPPSPTVELIAGAPIIRLASAAAARPTELAPVAEPTAPAPVVAPPVAATPVAVVAVAAAPVAVAPVAAAPVAVAPVAVAPVAVAPVAVAPVAVAPLEPAAGRREAAARVIAAAKPPPRRVKAAQEGSVKLPCGASPRLRWALTLNELRLTPELAFNAQVSRAFVLTGPPRAVFDVTGAAPERSHVVPASAPYATAVRLGKQGTGTRIVIDLDSAPKRTIVEGTTLVMSF